MAIGDMLSKAAGLLGGGDGPADIISKISESGLDLSSLADMDAEAAMALLQENGIDLSMLEGLGMSPEDLIAKVKEML